VQSEPERIVTYKGVKKGGEARLSADSRCAKRAAAYS